MVFEESMPRNNFKRKVYLIQWTFTSIHWWLDHDKSQWKGLNKKSLLPIGIHFQLTRLVISLFFISAISIEYPLLQVIQSVFQHLLNDYLFEPYLIRAFSLRLKFNHILSEAFGLFILFYLVHLALLLVLYS